MSTMVSALLSLLLLLGSAVPQETHTGSYYLSFLYTGVSRPTDSFPSFQATAYLNDQIFFHYDSESRKAVPLDPWSQMQGIEDWEKESELQQARESIFMETLQDIMDYYKDKEGSHTFQGRFGCELLNNKSSEAFWKYAYDGQNFIEFNKEIPVWVPQDPAALITKQKWEAEDVYVQRAKAYLEEECPAMLRRYLQYGKTFLDRQDPPSMSITNHRTPGEDTIKCWAIDFYPRDIHLDWNQGGNTVGTEVRGDVLPSGNGSYLSWVSLALSPWRNKSTLFCHIMHSSLDQPLIGL
ncbi:zinc-alpha-2-glycoprotein [Hyaena hyaena]|uniref:zinc-alpha-2-glycoprotein n=1 Tax=Hyaena hyaena TaxID=95912 RepID=UPI0019204C9B|nr:zinc-alpha-2-glycoprotein [Hyaena hyaena]